MRHFTVRRLLALAILAIPVLVTALTAAPINWPN
jgi:hypothetical protein